MSVRFTGTVSEDLNSQPVPFSEVWHFVKPAGSTQDWLVADVLKKGPAAEAGIKVGDRIVKVNNEDITSTSHLINYVALQAPNTDIQVEVIRGEQTVNLTVKVGERKVQSADSQFIPLPRR